VENCFFGGTLNGSAESKEYAFIITATADSTLTNNYYPDGISSANVLQGVSAVNETTVAGLLNGGIDSMAKSSGISAVEFKNWSTENGAPELIWGFTNGDVNSNGKIDVFDAVLVLKHIAGISSLSEKGQLAATGVFGQPVKVTDAVAILRYIARITSKI